MKKERSRNFESSIVGRESKKKQKIRTVDYVSELKDKTWELY